MFLYGAYSINILLGVDADVPLEVKKREESVETVCLGHQDKLT